MEMKETVIYDDINFPEGEALEWLKSDFAEYTGRDPEDGDALWDYWHDILEQDYENDIEDGLFKNVEGRVLVRGASHRWDGTKYGYQDFRTIEDAFDWVTKDCDYCRVFEDEHGELNIVGYHHDGSCSVEVREMTDAAENFLDEWEAADEGEPLYKMSTHDALGRVWNLCQPLDYCHKAWGCASKVTSAGAAEC